MKQAPNTCANCPPSWTVAQRPSLCARSLAGPWALGAEHAKGSQGPSMGPLPLPVCLPLTLMLQAGVVGW